jgi:hypothetical protein
MRQGIFHYPYVKQLINEQLREKKIIESSLDAARFWYEKYISGRSFHETRICG